MTMFAALAYAALTTPAIFVQCALAAGAPWGALTLGGAWPGQLPARMRPVAVLQAVLLGCMVVAVLSQGQVITLNVPRWGYPAAMVLTVLTLLSNSFTPSKPERRLWMPITAGMLVTGLLTGLG